MRIARVVPGEPVPADLAGDDIGVLARTTQVQGERWLDDPEVFQAWGDPPEG